MVSREPVRAPLPYVAGGVEEAVAVRLERVHWRRSVKAVLARVLHGEGALPDVAAMLPVGDEFVAPGVAPAFEPAAGAALPLRFGRQPLPGPTGVGLGVPPGDVNDGMVPVSPARSLRPLGPPPVPSRDLPPPCR